jgi:hypothetical protein
MAQTNVQAFSGDVEISSNLAVNTDDLFVDTESGRVGIGKTDPGVALDVAGDVEISSNLAVNTNDLFVDTESGRVGIGVTNPGYKLQVSDTVYINKALAPGTISTDVTRGDSKLLLYDISADNWSGIGNDSGGRFWLTTGTVGTRHLFVMDSGGKVGIGVTNPVAKLTVLGTGATFPTWYNSSYYTGTIMVNNNEYNVETSRVPAQHKGTLVLSSDHAHDSGYNAAGSIGFAAKNQYNGYSVQYGQVSGVRLGNFFGGLSFSTMHSDSTGELKEAMRISNGNVGIGTTNPATPLNINKLTATINPKAHTTTEFIRLRGDKVIGETYAISGGIKLGGDTGGTSTADGRIEFYANDGANVGNSYGDVPDNFVMCIRGDGNVGIGTTNPYQGNLTVYALGADPNYRGGELDGAIADATDFTGLAHFKSSGAHGVVRISNTNFDGTTRIDFNTKISGAWQSNYFDGTRYRNTAPTAGRILVEGETSDNYEHAYMAFSLCRDSQVDGVGNTGSLYERMRITSNGNVGIGTSGPGKKLEISHGHESLGGYINTYRVSGVVGGTVIGTRQGGGAYVDTLYITDSGSVGLGTNNPGHKLHVNGNVFGSGFFNKRQSFYMTPNVTYTVFTASSGMQGYVFLIGEGQIQASMRISWRSGWTSFYYSSVYAAGLNTWAVNGSNIWARHAQSGSKTAWCRVLTVGTV